MREKRWRLQPFFLKPCFQRHAQMWTIFLNQIRQNRPCFAWSWIRPPFKGHRSPWRSNSKQYTCSWKITRLQMRQGHFLNSLITACSSARFMRASATLSGKSKQICVPKYTSQPCTKILRHWPAQKFGNANSQSCLHLSLQAALH